MKILGITQARLGSSRLPGKVLKEVDGTSLLELHLRRASASKLMTKLIVATTTEPGDEAICELATRLGYASFRGSASDVLDRFFQAARPEAPDYVVRITSDCPLIDPALIDSTIRLAIDRGLDYASNNLEPTYPDGMDVEVFRFDALERAWHEAKLPSEREHVTPYIWKNSTAKGHDRFRSACLRNPVDYSDMRITVDEPQDYELVAGLIRQVGTQAPWLDYVIHLQQHPDLKKTNMSIERNEGYMKSLQNDIQLPQITEFGKSDAYRAKIHDLIPGGAHTYSKGDDQFPLLSPAAITHGKGAYVWDVDGNKFLDCSMGLSAISLGHAYEPVLDKVRVEIEKGVNFQRPAIIEAQVAEKFLSLVKVHDMIKFAKNGSTVTTAAVKLARAYTGRKLVAFPYDHPFYSYDDWFIGKSPCSRGIPEEIQALSVTYKADDIDSLRALFERYPDQIACVISEPEKSAGVPEGYVARAIDLAHEHGALYILDEMITGFKTDFPGSIKKFGVVPDLATWGKGIANGFSFCCLTGKKEVMELGGIRKTGEEKVFLISTTHGAETHGLAAVLATIDVFEQNDVIGHNREIGAALVSGAQKTFADAGLSEFIQVIPCDWYPQFVFKNRELEVCQGMRTLFMQEMIRRGILFQGFLVPCFSHTLQDVDLILRAMRESVEVYRKALDEGYQRYLVGEPAKPVFRKFL